MDRPGPQRSHPGWFRLRSFHLLRSSPARLAEFDQTVILAAESVGTTGDHPLRIRSKGGRVCTPSRPDARHPRAILPRMYNRAASLASNDSNERFSVIRTTPVGTGMIEGHIETAGPALR
jgi:hypothetical protein